MKLFPIILLTLCFSCKEKPNPIIKLEEGKDIEKKNIEIKSYKIVCDTTQSIFLNTEDGSISTKDEITCDTIYN